MWASVIIFNISNYCVHSINSASPRSHAVGPEKDPIYSSGYSVDQVHGQPSGSAGTSELFRRVGNWAGGGSRGDVASDTGKFCLIQVPFSKPCWCWFICLFFLAHFGTWNILHVSVISLVLSCASSLLLRSLILSATHVNCPSMSQLLGICLTFQLHSSSKCFVCPSQIITKTIQTPSDYLSLSIFLYGSQKPYQLLVYFFCFCLFLSISLWWICTYVKHVLYSYMFYYLWAPTFQSWFIHKVLKLWAQQ
jgi:hypothetical protein